MRFSTRSVFVFLAAASLGLLAGGPILGDLLRLQPCYLCNFQRLISMVLALFALCGVAFPEWHRLWSALFGLTALKVATAAQQSGAVRSLDKVVECGFGDPTLVERIVDWLGMQWPSMFMVTGFCTNTDWIFLGLSLANWSGVCLLLVITAIWLFVRGGANR